MGHGALARKGSTAFSLPVAVALLTILTLSAAEGKQAAFPSQRLPTDSWIYDDLEKLVLLEAVDHIPLDTRPLARADVAALLSRALQADASFGRNPVAARLLREFAWELKRMGLSSPYEDTEPFMVVGDGGRFLRNYMVASGRLKAAPELDSRFGESSELGFEISLFLLPHLFVYEDLFVTEVPESEGVGDAIVAHTDLLLMTDRLYATLRTDHLDLTFGRDNVRWGPGRSGTLLLSDAAPPFFILGYRARLGESIVGEAIHGTLNAFEGRYVAGHRVELRLGRDLTVGLAESVRYDSPSVEPLYVIGIVPYALVEKLLYRDTISEGKAGHNQRNNLLQGIDVTWRPGGGSELYGELLVDDVSTESSEMPSRIAYQGGAKKIWKIAERLFILQGEYTRVWNYTYSVYYGRDFQHRDSPLGYLQGPDSENLTFWIDVDAGMQWSLQLEGNLTRKGEGEIGKPWCPEDFDSESCAVCGRTDASDLSGVVESGRALTARVIWNPRDNLRASMGLGVMNVRSEKHVEGSDRVYPVLEAGLRARW